MIGESVFYWPNDGDGVASSIVHGEPVTSLPAIITHEKEDMADLTIFTRNPDHLVIQRIGVVPDSKRVNGRAYYSK